MVGLTIIETMVSHTTRLIGLLQLTITWYKIRHAGGQAHYYSPTEIQVAKYWKWRFWGMEGTEERPAVLGTGLRYKVPVKKLL